MATISEWIKHLERRVAEAIAAAGLNGRLYATVEGPQTISLKFQLFSPTTANLKRILGLGQSITALTGQQATIRQDGALIVVQVDHPQPWTPPATALVKFGNRLNVPVGVDEEAAPSIVSFGRECPVLAYIGPPGSGKSTAIMSTVSLLAGQAPPKRVRFFVAAKHAAGWKPFESLDHMEEVSTDAGAAIDLIRYIAGPVLEARQRDGNIWPALFLIADDVTGLIEADSTIGSPLAVIATEGRKHNIFLILGLHGAGRNAAVGKGMVDEAIAQRIVYRPRRSDSGTRHTGQKGTNLDSLSVRPGDALYVAGRRARRIATPHGWERVLDRIAPARQVEPEPGPAPLPRRSALHPGALATRESAARSTPAPAERGDENRAHVARTDDPAPLARIRRVSPGAIEEPGEIGEPREPTAEERGEIINYILQRRAAGKATSGRKLIEILYRNRRGKTTQAIAKSLLAEAERWQVETGIDPFDGEPKPAALPQRMSEEEAIRAEAEAQAAAEEEAIRAGTVDWGKVNFATS